MDNRIRPRDSLDDLPTQPFPAGLEERPQPAVAATPSASPPAATQSEPFLAEYDAGRRSANGGIPVRVALAAACRAETLSVHADGRLLRAGDELAAGATLSFCVPQDVARVTVSATLGGIRHGLAWRMPDNNGDGVVIGDAADVHGNVVVAGSARTTVRVKGAADVHGDIVVRLDAPSESWQPMMLESARAWPEAPGGLAAGWRECTLWVGRQLVIGRSASCGWRVHCGDARGFVLFDRYDCERFEADVEDLERIVRGSGGRIPLSMHHCTLEWNGASDAVRLLDGYEKNGVQRPSSRGVLVNGVRLDAGRQDLPLPIRIALIGCADGRWRAEIAVRRLVGADGGPKLLLRRTDGDGLCGLCLWGREGTAFGFTGDGAGGWCATPFEAECGLRLVCRGDRWHVLQATTKGAASRALFANDRLETPDGATCLVAEAGPDRVRLVR